MHGKQVRKKGEGGGLTFPFLENWKKCSDLGKNALIVRIYR